MPESSQGSRARGCMDVRNQIGLAWLAAARHAGDTRQPQAKDDNEPDHGDRQLIGRSLGLLD